MTEYSRGGREHVKTALHQFMKRHCVYDNSNRLSEVYEAAVDIVHGAPCFKTQYTYVGTTNRVENSKESEGAWNSSWDIP